MKHRFGKEGWTPKFRRGQPSGAVRRKFSGTSPVCGAPIAPAFTGSSLTAGRAQSAPRCSPHGHWLSAPSIRRWAGPGPRPAGRRPRLRAAGSGGPVWRKRRGRASSASASLALHKMAKIAKTHEGKNSSEGLVSAPDGTMLGHRLLLVFLPGSRQRQARLVGRGQGGPGLCVMAAAFVSTVPGPGGGRA